MEDRYQQLKEFQIEILEKFYVALDRVPLPVLEKFPNFNARTFQDLKILYQHVKAKTRLVETKLTHIKVDGNQKPVDNNSCEITNTCTSNSTLSKTTGGILNQQSILTISDSDSFAVSSFHVNDIETNYINTKIPESIFSPAAKEFYQPLQNKNEPIEEQKDSTALTCSPDQAKLNDFINQRKKSRFQLKRPIKATLGTQISKQIGEIWDKEEKSRATIVKVTDSSLDLHTTSNSSYKPERVEINTSIYSVQEKKENLQFNEKLEHDNMQNDEYDVLDTIHGKSC